jgi:hypothetical protein
MSKYVTLSFALVIGLSMTYCASAPIKDPAVEVKKLIVLYEKSRPKFVVQKQKIIQDSSCERATRLRKVIDQMVEDAEMEVGNTITITKVQMELRQAEQGCLDK